MAAEREGILGNLYASCLERSIPGILKFVYSLQRELFFLGEVLFMAEQKDLIVKLQEKCPSGKISCSEAREFADKMDIALKDMGKLCDQAGIKIFGCELGCF